MNDSPPSAPRPFGARLAWSVLAVAGAFLALCAIAALAVPLVIEHVVFPRLGESIGRQVAVERIRFNPFKLALSIGGLRVADTDPAADFVKVENVEADLSLSSVRHLAPVIDTLRISEPVVDLHRLPDGRFNFSDILDRLQASPGDSETTGESRFALRDFSLTGGEVRLDDRLLQQKHLVSDLQISVPFISNLDDARGEAVHPVVTALVNGSALSVTGVSIPFSGTRETSLDVTLRDVEIATYLPLSPVTLPLAVKRGRLGTELKVEFAQEGDRRKLAVSGTTQVDDLQIDARDGAKLMSAARLRLGLDRIAPLAGDFLFGDLDVEGLDVMVERGTDGGFPIARALEPEQSAQKQPPTGSPEAGKPEAAQAAVGEPQTPSASDRDESVRWSLRRTRLAGGRVAFRDRSVAPAVQLVHSDVDLELAEIGNRQERAAAGKLSLRQNESSTLSWAGEVDLARSRAAGRLEASIASLAAYRPYLAGVTRAGLDTGALTAEGNLELGWSKGLQVEVADAQASVQGARLALPDDTRTAGAKAAGAKPADAKPAIVLGRVAAEGVTLSLAGRRADLARLEVSGADLVVERDAAGNLNLQRLAAVGNGKETGETVEQARPVSNAAAGRRMGPEAWTVKVARVDLAGNRVAWRDLGASQPVSVAISDLGGTIGPVGTDLSTSSSVDLKARVGENGALTARGALVAEPLSLQLAVQVQRLALAVFDPYVAEKLALGIDEGSLGTTGQLDYGDDRLRYRGRLEVDGLRSRERATSAPAIRWQKLLLEDIDVDVEPAELGPGDRITVGGITLSEFFARVELSEQGRFNLQDIVVTEASTRALARADAQAKARAAGGDAAGSGIGNAAGAAPQPTEADEGTPPPGGSTPQANRSDPEPSPALPQAAADGPTIRVGRIKLERGSSNFTDRFVQPNYSVNLTELDGSLSAMASDDPKPADLALTGRVDGNAPIDISGKINPFGPTLYTDVHAVAKGIDLPTLTPYSLKYAGYAIEKGKLSLDVHYTIENEQLRADNNLFLDQLTLGEKVEGPGATSLPIQFALSLLKNSKGEINVTLPVSGSLDDPQFSIGGLIGRAIGNLLTRVITAPFSALASAFGGGGGGGAEELSFVEFRAGTSSLTDESLKRLQTLSKGLLERPALKLEIAGRVDPKAEKDAIVRQGLDARLKALKRRRAGGADAAALEEREEARDRQESAASQQQGPQGARDQRDRQAQARQAQASQEEAAVAAGVTLSKEEYPVFLRLLYEEAGLAGKARGASASPESGSIAKPAADAPAKAAPDATAAPGVAEMEKQLLETIAVDAETTRRLATRRSQVVRRWLAAQGKVPEDRMFMLAPRLSPDAVGPNQSKPQCSASCAEFSLR